MEKRFLFFLFFFGLEILKERKSLFICNYPLSTPWNTFCTTICASPNCIPYLTPFVLLSGEFVNICQHNYPTFSY